MSFALYNDRLTTSVTYPTLIITRIGTISFSYSYNITNTSTDNTFLFNDPYYDVGYNVVEKVSKSPIWFDKYRTQKSSKMLKFKYNYRLKIFKTQTRRSKIQRRNQKRKIYIQKL